MEPDDPITKPPLEEQIAELFRTFDYDVQQTVGIDPGTVDWFAVPRSGFLQPRTYFRALRTYPASLETALVELEAARKARGADRAVAIVMEGRLPDGYVPDLAARRANILTFRRWVLEISGIGKQLRRIVDNYEATRRHELYLPRRARIEGGEEVQVEPFIDSWVEQTEHPILLIHGPRHGGKATVAEHAIYQTAIRFLENPETVTPLLPIHDQGEDAESLASNPFVIPVLGIYAHNRTFGAPAYPGLWLSDSEDELSEDELSPEAHIVRLQLISPSPDEVTRWFHDRVDSRELATVLVRARQHSPDFLALSNSLPDLELFLQAVRQEPKGDQSRPLEQWITAVVISFVRLFIHARCVAPLQHEFKQGLRELEDSALHDFGFGSTSGLRVHENEFYVTRMGESWWDQKSSKFRNLLMRDYFLARKVVREVKAGNVEILLRYQFPQSVLLFLTLLAPEVSARLTGDQVARLEEKMQEEVERKLQLMFAHMLHRPVGLMRAHLQEIREGIGKDKATELARPLERMAEEIAYIARLAEKTRLWQAEPKGTPVGVPLRLLIEDLAIPLKEKYPAVTCAVKIDPETRVRAIRDALHEVLHCLLENAFHAALTDSPVRQPAVTIAARSIGDLVRVEVRDSGAGVPSEDRDRIFEPWVTTKKGGAGKPQGTGLGLSIARRYAEHMGGRVGLGADQPETCFFLDLVAWRESA